jgi:hypothetical protein
MYAKHRNPKDQNLKNLYIVLELFVSIVFHNSFIESFQIAIYKCIPVSS